MLLLFNLHLTGKKYIDILVQGAFGMIRFPNYLRSNTLNEITIRSVGVCIFVTGLYDVFQYWAPWGIFEFNWSDTLNFLLTIINIYSVEVGRRIWAGSNFHKCLAELQALKIPGHEAPLQSGIAAIKSRNSCQIRSRLELNFY